MAAARSNSLTTTTTTILTEATTTAAAEKPTNAAGLLCLTKSDSFQPINNEPLVSKMDFLQTMPYTPRDVPLYDYKGRRVKRYSCDSCADCFLFKTSLNQHINRRSVKIICKLTFQDGSKNDLKFYNRCAQFYYFKDNYSPTLVSQDTSILPLYPQDSDTFVDNILPDYSKEETTKEVYTKVKTMDESSEKLTLIKSKKDVNRSSKDHLKEGFKKDSAKSDHGCLECGSVFSNLLSRREHFLNLDKDRGPFQCDVCSFWCPNQCSLEAHKRLHSGKSPYICPECGYHQEKSFKKLLTHCTIKCQHLFRQLFYICSHCKATLRTISSLIEHITINHTKQLIKCSTCNQPFDSIDEFEKHKVKHPTPEDGFRMENLFQCGFCQKEVSSKILYFTHIETHLKQKKDMIRFSFNCPQCKERSCDSGHQVLVHLQAAHLLDLSKPDREAKLIEDVCSRHKIKFKTESTIASPELVPKSSASTSSSLHTTDTGSKTATATKFACEICGQVTGSWDDMADHGLTSHIEQGLFVCLICSNKPFKRRNSLLAHLRKFHTSTLSCPSQKCSSLRFSTPTDMYTHYRVKHRLLDANSIASETSPSKNGQPISRRGSDPPIPSKKIKMNSMKPPKQRDTSLPSLNGSSGILKKSLTNGGSGYHYQCIQCGFQAETVDKLRAHYTSHRTAKAPYLCYECGTNFVSYPSLERHLVSQHGINDCHSYVKTNLPDLHRDNSDVNNDVDLLGIIHDERLSVSMCPVCSKICSDATALKSHVKVHGMAFIKSCQKNLNTSSVTHDVA